MKNNGIKEIVSYIIGGLFLIFIIWAISPNGNNEDYEDRLYQIEELENEIDNLKEEITNYESQINDLENYIEILKDERDGYDKELYDCLCTYATCPQYSIINKDN